VTVKKRIAKKAAQKAALPKEEKIDCSK